MPLWCRCWGNFSLYSWNWGSGLCPLLFVVLVSPSPCAAAWSSKTLTISSLSTSSLKYCEQLSVKPIEYHCTKMRGGVASQLNELILISEQQAGQLMLILTAAASLARQKLLCLGHITELCAFCGIASIGKDGRGEPVFTGEVDCTYFFTWDTKYACVKEKEDLLCGASDGKKRYDLSVLARHSGIAFLSGDHILCVHKIVDPSGLGKHFNCQLSHSYCLLARVQTTRNTELGGKLPASEPCFF